MTETIKEHAMNHLDPQKESIKLTKTTKGHTWEIKIHPQTEALTNEDILRVEKLNDKMRESFGE